MNIAEKKIALAREEIKNEIVNLVKEIFIATHGNIPQMVYKEDGNTDYYEDWRIDVRNSPNYVSILVEITSSYDECLSYERYPINEYIVTLDDDLYFYPTELEDEIHWKEINTDDLVALYTYLLGVKAL